MVVTLVWMHNWAAVTISICVLVILVLFLAICLCWEGRKTKTLQQFYILDENGMKKLTDVSDSTVVDTDANSTGFFRRFSSAGTLKPYFTFGNRIDTDKVLSTYQKEHVIENEKDLLDSLDFEKQFRQTRLQIDICDQQYLQPPKQPEDDCLSCNSNDSRHSFYSVYPYARTNSVAETMKSAYSHPEMLDI